MHFGFEHLLEYVPENETDTELVFNFTETGTEVIPKTAIGYHCSPVHIILVRL